MNRLTTILFKGQIITKRTYNVNTSTKQPMKSREGWPANMSTYSRFTLATSELCQTGLVSFSKADISRTTDTCQVSVVH